MAAHQAPLPWDSPGKNIEVGCHFLLQCVKVKSLSRAQLFATPWTAPYQAPPSMGFSRQEYRSGVPLPSPIYTLQYIKYGLPRWCSGKESTCQCRRHKRHRFKSLGQEDPLEEGMATHSSILAWSISWTEKPGGLQTTESQRTGQAEMTYHARTACLTP